MNRAILKTASLCLLAAGLTFVGCKKDSNPAITISSLTAGSTDLNGATSATGVALNSTFVATFSTTVDPATANTTNITLSSGSTSTNVGLNITTSGSTVTIDPAADLNGGGNYTLTFTGIKSDKGEVMATKSVTFKTEGIGLGTAPQAASQVMYLQLNGGISDLTGNATVAPGAQVAYMADRFGKANSAANFRGATSAGNGDLVELSGLKLIAPSMSISFWCKMDPTNFPVGTSRPIFGYNIFYGYQLEVGNNLDWFKWTSRHKVNPDPNGLDNAGDDEDPNGDGNVSGETTFDYTGSIPALLSNKWVQIVLTFDALSAVKTIYIDGNKIMEKDLDFITGDPYEMHDIKLGNVVDATQTPRTGLGDKLALGWWVDKSFTTDAWATFSGATNTYIGGLDDFRIWNKQLTGAEVSTLYNAEKP
ncbi:MAG: Ig-like domain-containing protein [Bacteroidia bacterium]